MTRNRTYDNGSEYLFTLKINKYTASICSILTNRLLDSSKIKYDFYIDDDFMKQLSPEKHVIDIIISEKNATTNEKGHERNKASVTYADKNSMKSLMRM